MFLSFLLFVYAIRRRNAGERDSDLYVDGRLAQGDHRARQRGQPRCQKVSLSLGHCLLRILLALYSGSGSTCLVISYHFTKDHPGFFV
jgi:hypothetical protein